MAYTISTHNGTRIARGHNIRDRRITDKESHIDPEGWYEIWADHTEREAYHKIFDRAVKEFNSKQTRESRKIADYYEKIKGQKQKHTSYEMIVTIGNCKNHPPADEAREILKEFIEGWYKSNPNLCVYTVAFHADEAGQTPHLHIDYIPCARFTKGLSLQTSLTKALEQMGFQSESIGNTAQIQWEHAENKRLEEICKEHGYEIEHPHRNRKHEADKTVFIAQQIEREHELDLEYGHEADRVQREADLSNQIADLKSENTELRRANSLLTECLSYIDGQLQRVRENDFVNSLRAVISKAREAVAQKRQKERAFERTR